MIPYTKNFGDRSSVMTIFARIGAGGISACDFQEALRSVRRTRSLCFWIDCEGGEIPHAEWIHDEIRQLPFETTSLIVGACNSAAWDIALACRYRTALDGATGMFHQASGSPRAVEDDRATIVARYLRRIEHLNLENRFSRAQLEAWVDEPGGTWFSAPEMKFFGLVTSVSEPSDRCPLRTFQSLEGKSRPRPSYPFVQTGASHYSAPVIAERPAVLNHHYETARKREPIVFPPMPASLRGKVICCAQDAADIKARLTSEVSRGPIDPETYLAVSRAKALLAAWESL